MDATLSKIADLILSQSGLVGAIAIIEGFILWRFWQTIQTLQDKRIEEAKTGTQTLASNTSALDRLSDLIRDRKA